MTMSQCVMETEFGGGGGGKEATQSSVFHTAMLLPICRDFTVSTATSGLGSTVSSRSVPRVLGHVHALRHDHVVSTKLNELTAWAEKLNEHIFQPFHEEI